MIPPSPLSKVVTTTHMMADSRKSIHAALRPLYWLKTDNDEFLSSESSHTEKEMLVSPVAVHNKARGMYSPNKLRTRDNYYTTIAEGRQSEDS
jgi:hypothetical protein